MIILFLVMPIELIAQMTEADKAAWQNSFKKSRQNQIKAGVEAREAAKKQYQEHDKTTSVNKTATLYNSAGNPIARVKFKVTFLLETALVMFDGTVENLSRKPIWSTYYVPHLSYYEGKDWYMFTTKPLSEDELPQYKISPGVAKEFHYVTESDISKVIYNSSDGQFGTINTYTTKEFRTGIMKKYLAHNSSVVLEIFPDRRFCIDCGIKMD